MITLHVARKITRPQYQRMTATVQVHGFGKLTPKAARAALEIAFGNDAGGEVWTDGEFDSETGEHIHGTAYGYRVYASSARKFDVYN